MRKVINGNKVCAVKAHSLRFGETWNDITDLLVTATRGKVFTEEDSLKFSYLSMEGNGPDLYTMLGYCYKQAEWRSKSPSIAEEDCLESDDWLYAVLKVGGASKADVAKKKKIVTQALNAAKAAKKEGIVPGGGIAFLNASKELDKLQITNYGQKIGVQIIQDALKMPVFTIAASAGVKGSVVVGKLLEQDNPNLGYDVANGEYLDMIKHGIVDPLKVIRTSFVGATRMFLKELLKPKLYDYEKEFDAGKVKQDDPVGVIQGKAI